jgi:ABC-2 type transport system permease protein
VSGRTIAVGDRVGADTRPDSARETLRWFWTSVKLGYLTEANWTDPLLFFIYSVAKPIAAALILVVMLQVVGGNASAQYRSFVVIGTSLWTLVQTGITGLSFAILDDRERYRMLKYLYVSPSDFVIVLLGRGVSRLLIGVSGAVITIGLGVLLLGVPFDPFRIDWPVLLLTIAGGLAVTLALGLFMAGVCLQTRQESWSYPEAFAGALFLVSGSVFPIAILPVPLQAVAMANPLAWFVDGARRAFDVAAPTSIGGPGSLFLTLTGASAPDAGVLLVSLLVTGAVVTLAAAVVFRLSSRRAKERGLLDRTTGS